MPRRHSILSSTSSASRTAAFSGAQIDSSDLERQNHA